ncbi:PilZ domain-containing protein [Sphingomonas sp. CFBP 13714]|nr:PilZ domain-containing protein [Sphingomonas sp. CFBP 8765]MBD8551932.1 PilZ domain-containing protein [Sphingomonas sp. CFBP 8764]MBD8641170.1 PilZ domain-containing protein [Sphingomonas sp. CFBP 13733]MBD8701736.1 PilZ domain-containing protein [Sphingomonas sp. CFBP 13714]MBD8736642.1 PilZ domain-containing protein [Sphingomonas sp. CFBP 13706]RZL74783.1 MAG: PilZ domain-containing protein [Sphingomonas sp.]
MIARFSYADGAGVYEVRVRNLSEGGLMIEFDRPLAVDTPVTIDLRGIGEVTGRVAWCTQGRLGIALDETIDPMKARKSVGQGQTTPTFAKPIVFREPRSR